MEIEQFCASPLLGILRGINSADIEALVNTAVAAGLKALEITMNTAGAADLIAKMVDVADGRLLVGAGTVLQASELSDALAAGASFIVTPVFIKEISTACARKGIPLFPGALTPKEVYEAWQAGAEMIKLFPASCFGPAYIKELGGPFPDIKIMACGGVSADNVGEYLRCGASGVAFGGSIFRQDWIDKGEYDKVEHALRQLLSAFHGASESGSRLLV